MLPNLIGCAGLGQWCHNGFKVGPNYSTTAATVADSWIDGNDPHLRSVQGDNACWWAAFGDPALNRLVAEASEQNLTLKMAGTRILEARAVLGIAGGNLFPQQQEASAQYSRNAMSANAYPFNLFPLQQFYYDNWSAGLNAAWELDFWGRFRRAIEAADARLDAEVEGYDNVLVLLQAEVAANYMQMRSAEERLALAQKNFELQSETLRIVTLRQQQGLVTELDVQQATTNLGATEALLPTFRAVQRRAQNRLCILTGKPPYRLSQVINAPGLIPLPPQEVVVGIPAELLRRRPDVRQAEREAAAQSARIGIAESEFYPQIAITGTIGAQADNASQLFQPSSLVGAIGPGFHWNILNYGRIKNNVNVEEARFQRAIINYRDVVLRANEEVENGIIGYLTEQDRLRALDKSTRAAARSVEIAMLQYRRGLISYQPLLDSQRALVLQQDAVTESRSLVAIDLVAIYKALGGGWQARLYTQSPAPVPAAEPVPVPQR
jgi:NodT family efflux transporter outer membrane factor (OMF) lipoprotein